MDRRSLLKTIPAGAASLAMPGLVLSQTRPIKIGQITDYTGPYRDNNGPGEEYSLQLAIQDHNGGKLLGRPVELIVGDHLNKADIATEIAKKMIEVDKVDAMVPSGSSVAALAVHGMCRDKGIITMMGASAATSFTEKDCSPWGFHWVMDTYAYPRSAVAAAGENAKKKWFFIAIDNVFGETSMVAVRKALQESGGQVAGLVKTPLNTTDYASFIAQAQASRAEVVCILNAGADQIRLLKQMQEFGVRAGGQTIVAPSLLFTDVVAVGLEATQGIRCAESFYWNQNDAARAFSRRFFAKIGRMPAMSQGHHYAAMAHYLRAVEAAKTTETKAVAAAYRSLPEKSGFYRNLAIRPNGRVIYDANILRIRNPSEMTAGRDKNDLAEVVGSIPADKIFRAPGDTECKIA